MSESSKAKPQWQKTGDPSHSVGCCSHLGFMSLCNFFLYVHIHYYMILLLFLVLDHSNGSCFDDSDVGLLPWSWSWLWTAKWLSIRDGVLQSCLRACAANTSDGEEGNKMTRKEKDGGWKIEFTGEKPPTPLLDTINYPVHMKNLSTQVNSSIIMAVI